MENYKDVCFLTSSKMAATSCDTEVTAWLKALSSPKFALSLSLCVRKGMSCDVRELENDSEISHDSCKRAVNRMTQTAKYLQGI